MKRFNKVLSIILSASMIMSSLSGMSVYAADDVEAAGDTSSYSVAFNGNGSTSGTMENETFSTGVEQALSANAFSKQYQVTYDTQGGSAVDAQTATVDFTGWNTSADGSGTAYSDEASVTDLTASGSEATLYAQWGNTASVTLGATSKDGYTFDGWYDAAADGNKIGVSGDSYTATGDITLYAHWTENVAVEEPVVEADIAGEADDIQSTVSVSDNWYTDYTYTLKTAVDGILYKVIPAGNYIVCTAYTGSATEIEVPATATIDGVTYNTILQGGVFYENSIVTSIKIDDGVRSGDSCWNMFNCAKSDYNFEEHKIINKTSLSSIDITRLDTSACIDMSDMFADCSGLTSLDVSKINTSACEYMNYMFNNCSGLTSLDVSGFNTLKVKKMSGMFGSCSGLTSLDVSSFDTPKVNEMNGMFNSCSGLTSLDVSGFDTSACADLQNIFEDCSSIKYLNINRFDTSACGNLNHMLFGCSDLLIINTPKKSGSVSADLPITMYNLDGTAYTTLPINATNSITLRIETIKIVSFAGNDNTLVDLKYIKSGETASRPADPTKTGYSFTGWYSDADCETLYDFNTPVTADTTIYAGWAINNYTVSFNDADVVSQTVSYNHTASRPADPTKTGYSFTGWYSDADCETLYDFDTPVIADTTIYAGWMIKAFTVSFNVDSKTVSSVSVSENDKVVTQAAPSKTGYIFEAWYSDVTFKTIYNFNTPVAKDITLYAKYTKVKSGSGTDSNISTVSGSKMFVKGQTYSFGIGTWTSSDPTVATVNKNTGAVIAKKAGSTVIASTGKTIIKKGISTSYDAATYNVTVIEPVISDKTISLVVGDQQVVSMNNIDELQVAWKSGNIKVASVVDGTITAVGTGSTKIYAYVNGKSYICNVKVAQTMKAPAKDASSVKLVVGQTAAMKYSDRSFKVNKATWTVSDASVVSMNKSKLTALKAGKTTVTGLYNGIEKNIDVEVKAISFATDIYINVDKTSKISLYKVNSNKATWTSSSTSVATVVNGKVKGISEGTSTITCSYKGNTYNIVAHVEKPVIVSNDIIKSTKKANNYNISLSLNQSYNVKLGGVNQVANWKSSNSKVASVDEFGTIKGLKAGKATIYTVINGTTVRISVKVSKCAYVGTHTHNFNYNSIILAETAKSKTVVHICECGDYYITTVLK